METFFESSGSWRFLRHNEIYPEGVPVKINRERNKICLFIPYGIKGLTIELDHYSYKKKQLILSGSYTIHDLGLSDSVTFKIQKNASRFIGIPEGFHDIVQWKLWKEL